MDQNQAIERARQFARTRYTGEMENILREGEQEIAEMRNQLAARGMLSSGNMVHETAKIDAATVKAITEARLDATLEGYELYGVHMDDQMAINLCDEIAQGMNQLVFKCKLPDFGRSLPTGLQAQYPRIVEKMVGLSANLIKTQIDRRRLMAKKDGAPTTNYYVQGENARVNVNSTDHSVNVVMKSTEEFFGAIRQRIESEIPNGERKREVLDALAALQESHGKASFAQRYTAFISAAADYVTLLTPFIPQLTQMLGHVLK